MTASRSRPHRPERARYRSHRPEHVRRRRVFVVATVIVIAVGAFVSGAAAVSTPRHPAPKPKPAPPPIYTRAAATSQQISCPSTALDGQLPAMVYLPSGYTGGTGRYPVIYFLHGLPANRTAYQANSFVGASVPGGAQGAIVVAPQGARADGSDREYLDWDATEDWPQALTHDLTHCIDQRYRTIPRRTGRALVGLSAGGYGAFNIGLRALDTFGAVESWSGYFAATDPSGYHYLQLGSPRADSAAKVPTGSALTASLKRDPAFIGFYVGNQDNRFLGMNRQFDATLAANHITHTFAVYPGGHTLALWSAQASHWLGLALNALAAERAAQRSR